MSEDSELLRRYAEEGLDSAFTELVRRHLDLVYATALRKVGGDTHLAKDVAQRVFTDLASKASSLQSHPVLSGWLFTSTHFAATQIVRTETRRRKREEKAQAMNEILHETDSVAAWEHIRPLLDDLINELDPRDREAVCLRFFEGKTLRSVGDRLKLSEDGARSRVDRALDKLHGALARRGVKSTTGALAAALAVQAGGAAPAGLVATVSAAALSGAAAGAAAATTAGAISIFMSTTKVMAVLSVALFGIGMAIYQTIKTGETEAALSQTRQEFATAREQMALMRGQIRGAEQRANAAEAKNDALSKIVEAGDLQKADAVTASLNDAKRDHLDKTEIDNSHAFSAELIAIRISNSATAHRTPSDDPLSGFKRDLASAERYFAENRFPIASTMLNVALLQLPQGLPIPEEAKALKEQLQLQRNAVQVPFESDGLTHVTIKGERILGLFGTTTASVPPGDYDVVGHRQGYADVTVKLQVRNSEPPQPPPVVTIACTEPAGP